VHDFELVAVFQSSSFPASAGNNVKIQLDGDSVALHAELGHEGGDGQSVREVAGFAIEVENQLLAPSHQLLAFGHWFLALGLFMVTLKILFEYSPLLLSSFASSRILEGATSQEPRAKN